MHSDAFARLQFHSNNFNFLLLLKSFITKALEFKAGLNL